jgi:hypothetical protein
MGSRAPARNVSDARQPTKSADETICLRKYGEAIQLNRPTSLTGLTLSSVSIACNLGAFKLVSRLRTGNLSSCRAHSSMSSGCGESRPAV